MRAYCVMCKRRIDPPLTHCKKCGEKWKRRRTCDHTTGYRLKPKDRKRR